MAPSPEFGMDKMNPAQKMNNKVEGTPKPESKKVEMCFYFLLSLLLFFSYPLLLY